MKFCRRFYQRLYGFLSLLLLLQECHPAIRSGFTQPKYKSQSSGRNQLDDSVPYNDQSGYDGDWSFRKTINPKGSTPIQLKVEHDYEDEIHFAPRGHVGRISKNASISKYRRSVEQRYAKENDAHVTMEIIKEQLNALSKKFMKNQEGIETKVYSYIESCSSQYSDDLNVFGSIKTPTGVIVRLMLAVIYTIANCQTLSLWVISEITEQIGKKTTFDMLQTFAEITDDLSEKSNQTSGISGMEKINFSGGEPFIVKRGTMVGEMVRFCKQTLQLPSVSVVSNGSLISENWFKKYGEYLDILAVSCDSFDPDTNEKIGRQQGQKNHLDSLLRVRRLCMEYKVAFKLNTVVNTYNKHEDMTDCILQLDPCRWKVFQCLLIDGENAGQDALRNAETFVINDEEFDKFLDMHKSVKCLVPESNEKMQNSYLILDEYMRFLDCTQGSKQPSRSLLDVGVDNALMFSGFDERMFLKRGGKYVWSKSDMNLEW
ncbi:radical S-adenosyl methionine domain-containing protein 2-like isoform X2 [Mercenaria mercenaria]|uniref:radical S-adenosyl methionine domain-containing protein 2-like isoform X2 n=1 Tax=Mercenaria mercenaria TaxID=6596 RepID=UPI00234E9342|nr:radical S-adenosyl methionine domain-containing protein 2-like isoform X2 [Mercenaria mercenaria]